MRFKWWWLIPVAVLLLHLLLTGFNKHQSSLSTPLLPNIPVNQYQQQIVRGQVTSWDTTTGRLMLWANNKNWEVRVDPAQMTVFTTMLRVIDKSGWRWQTAFCPGDEVVATYEQGQLVMVDNGGPRPCA
ncbi:MAG: hypothetical protein ACOYKC_02935 [Anaerolineaceae bacterium]|jgi:hypothetical protein